MRLLGLTLALAFSLLLWYAAARGAGEITHLFKHIADVIP